MLAKNTNKESITMIGVEVQTNVIPIAKKPSIIIMQNRRTSFCNGFFKGLKKFFPI